MPKRGLTPKQQRFCEEYLVDLNATQAALRAGYSPKGTKTQASLLLANINIQRQLMRLRSDLTERVNVDVDWVLSKLVENHARATQAIEVVDSDGNKIGEYKYEGAVANRALELLGKHFGAFVDRHQIDFTDNTGVLAISAEQSAEDWESEYGVAVQSPEPETEHKNGAVN